MMGKTDILVAGCQLAPSFVSHLFAERLVSDGQPVLDLLSNMSSTVDVLQGIAAKITPLPGPLYQLALARSSWSGYRNDVYIDRPIVLTAHTRGHETGSGNLNQSYSLDVVRNDVAVRPDSDIDPAIVRLGQGVADTAAEATLVSGIDGAQPAAHGGMDNVSEMYARRTDHAAKWITIRSTSDSAWKGIQLDADARERLSQDLSNGYLVVAPDHSMTVNGRPTFGWWRVDTKTGTTLGMGEQGWGAAMVEYAILIVDCAMCVSEFAPKGGGRVDNAGNFGNVLGMATCLMLGVAGGVTLAPAAKAVKGLKHAGLVIMLIMGLLAAAKKFSEYVE